MELTGVDGRMPNEHGDVISPVDTGEHQSGHAIVVAQGDSGGPVVADPSGPQASMTARGIIVAAAEDTQIPCSAGSDTAIGSTCFWQVLCVPMTPIVDTFNFSIS
ncbi:hypothetical protein [Kitasatospora sp. MAP5-34]|uniref:hypothetical protein n=1 Tax=Kitasatospora sp. MAP5-34 TaxID=3035102 RepID=UPI0024747781|nr:hypothetical protein [Kitasatospora sp. MAP5-34]MDH6577338.1 hypothetical protein [Kitasatospora sp. MAP5-34]